MTGSGAGLLGAQIDATPKHLRRHVARTRWFPSDGLRNDGPNARDVTGDGGDPVGGPVGFVALEHKSCEQRAIGVGEIGLGDPRFVR